MMIRNQGRDSTIDPYYFSKLSAGASSEEIQKLIEEIDELQATVYGSLSEEGLVTRTSTLEEIVAELKADGAKLQIKTSEEWAREEENTSYLNLIYFYKDIDEETGKIVEKIRVGDGVTKIKDLPFIADSSALETQVTPQEKEKWNNKVSVSLDGSNESIIFTTG